MRRLLVTFVAAAVLGLGAVHAQDVVVDDDLDFGVTTQYVGGSLGWPGLQLFYQNDSMDITDNSDLRFRLALSPFVGFGFSVGADILFDVAELDDTGEFSLYAGGGPSIGYRSWFAAGGFTFDLTALFGLNYRISPELSAFVEAGGGIGYWSVSGGGVTVGGIAPAIRSGLGVNYHF